SVTRVGRPRALRSGGRHRRRGTEVGAQGSAFAVANFWLDAGRAAATGIFVPPRAGRRTEGDASIWQWTVDNIDRQTPVRFHDIACGGRRFRPDDRGYEIARRGRDRGA